MLSSKSTALGVPISRSYPLFSFLFCLSLFAVGCDAGPAGGEDTDSPSTDTTDTDPAGADTGDTSITGTDPGDTDAADTDVVDTDVVDTDVPCEDADVDSICDNVDLCFGENSFGDLDADQICDNTDLCSGDNATLDADMDGICGNLDLCVGGDISGDTDADGTCDDQDPCYGVSPNDSDFDGVCDDSDLCSGDDATGDDDGDFICGDLDVCPLGDDNVDLDASGYPDACEPVELGRWHNNYGGFGSIAGVYPYASFLIEVGSACPSVTQGATALGQGLALSEDQIGTYSFSADDGYDFTALAACLTDGTAEPITMWGAMSDGPNLPHLGIGGTIAESDLGGSPDFAGHVLVRIDLEVASVTVQPNGGGGTQVRAVIDWVFYGYALP